ncbi:hypothetical protein B0H10DRAFT_2207690 [Mycena sp. CBHHK59/15]|nr:hypothetical protein B0H10DRAFT_2207690 [Mycena sp. CBHHK59/15]
MYYVVPSLKRATQIELSNVPRTATPADIRRLVARSQIGGVEQVDIEYRRLEPSGRAYLQLTHADFLLPGLDALEKVTISGVHPVAKPSDRKPRPDVVGETGDGISSELARDGKNAVVWGLPRRAGPELLDSLLGGFKFPPGEPYIFPLPMPEYFTMYSRFLVCLQSVSEAHRLVRQLHMTYHFDHKFQIRARVIY